MYGVPTLWGVVFCGNLVINGGSCGMARGRVLLVGLGLAFTCIHLSPPFSQQIGMMIRGMMI